MKPVLVIPGTDYVVCFNAGEEHVSMLRHFRDECGWSLAEFASNWPQIKNHAWFVAEVSLWRQGQELDTHYLGACCYERADEFWTTYACDYFSDYVVELVKEHCPEHLPWAEAWRQDLRKDHAQ